MEVKHGSTLAIFSELILLPASLVQPVAFAIHFEDMDVVGQSVEERAGERNHDLPHQSSPTKSTKSAICRSPNFPDDLRQHLHGPF